MSKTEKDIPSQLVDGAHPLDVRRRDRAKPDSGIVEIDRSPAKPDVTDKPIPPGMKDFFAILGVSREADARQITAVLREKVDQLYLESGAVYPGAVPRDFQLRINDLQEAHRVITGNEERNRYLRMIEQGETAGGRYKISGFASGLWEWSDDLRYVGYMRNRGLKVEDLEPGRPGGIDDPIVTATYRIVIPQGRKFAGTTFRNARMGIHFTDGVAYTSNPDIASYFRSQMDYVVEERAPLEDGSIGRLAGSIGLLNGRPHGK